MMRRRFTPAQHVAFSPKKPPVHPQTALAHLYTDDWGLDYDQWSDATQWKHWRVFLSCTTCARLTPFATQQYLERLWTPLRSFLGACSWLPTLPEHATDCLSELLEDDGLQTEGIDTQGLRLLRGHDLAEPCA